MVAWPNARSISAAFAFGHSQYEDPSSLTFEVVSPAGNPDAGRDPGPALDGFTIKRGRLGDAGATQPTEIALSLRNDNGEFSPRNVSGPRYGTLRRGTWTRLGINLGAGTVPLGTASALGFTPTRTGPGIDPQVAVQALGVLNRLGRDGTQASAQRRYYSQVSPQPIAYWPLENGDRRAALSFQSGVAGGSKLVVTQSTLFGVTRPFSAAGGVTPGPPGAASATDTSAGGYLAGPVPVVSSATKMRAELSMLANGFENTFPDFLQLRTSTRDYDFANTGQYCRIAVVSQLFAPDWKVGVAWVGPSSFGSVYTAPMVIQDNAWHHLQLDVSSSGGGSTTDYVLRIDGVSILSGTATQLPWIPASSVHANLLATDVDRAAHLAVWSGASLPTAADSYNAFLGNPGELAHSRISSTCTAVGIPYTSTASASEALGPQPTGSALAVLRDAEDADLGVLYERRDGRLTYQANRDRYNATVALTLRYQDVQGVYPNDDDRDIYNRITATRPDGAFGTAEQTSGPVGSNTSTGIGPRPVPVSRNLYLPDDLSNVAGWLLRIKTIDKPRYAVVIDLTAMPSLAAGVLACDIGSRIKIAGAPAEDHGPDALDLIIEGEQITYERGQLLVTWYCEPYEPWLVLIEANAAAPSAFDGREAHPGSTLTSEILPGTASVAVTNNPPVSWAATDLPYALRIGGEVVMCTVVAGTGASQTLTLSRSINGVIKKHPAGTQVQVVQPVAEAL